MTKSTLNTIVVAVGVAILTVKALAVHQSADVEQSSEELSRLASMRDLADLGRLVAHIEQQPLVVRISTATQLVASIDDDRPSEWSDHRSLAQFSHDPRVLGNRAATLLETCFSFEIPPLRTDAVESERAAAQRVAALQLDAYRLGILAAREAAGLERHSVADLKMKFQDAILKDAPEAAVPGVLDEDGREAFINLLEEWYPIGKRAEDLEEIVGRPARRSDTSSDTEWRLHYTFYHPFFGSEAVFLIKKSTIEAVQIRSGE